jgi:Flp pilus assembly protein TadG
MEVEMKKSLLYEDKGATAVETAMVMGVLVFLIFGIIQLGMAMWAWNTMGLAVQDAGRYVMVYNAGPPASCTAVPRTLPNCALQQMQDALATAPGAVSTACTTPAADQICLGVSTNAGTTPPLMTLTASYGFDVIGLVGPFTLTSQGIFPLD